jgi:predicted enzyme related to lactoylglutathione lyase
MSQILARLAGIELYFDDLDRATQFYRDTLGLAITGELPGHHTQFDGGAGFVCLEKKGVETYPSRDKAVLFFEVPDLHAAITAVGPERIVQSGPTWAVIHDPEGHNILLLQVDNE